MIFVFGSNKAGIHGAGAAKLAHKKYGAKWGIGEGITGGPETLCYALPTKGFKIEELPLVEINNAVNRFISAAEYWALRGAKFKVTRVGCGLGGKLDSNIAPMFKAAPNNCYFDEYWRPWLDLHGMKRNYWGTF
jgi:hypothetical protein